MTGPDTTASQAHEHAPLPLLQDNVSCQTPRQRFAHGQRLLHEGDARGVVLLFEAAEHDPALLGPAAESVEKWLDGPGATHDSVLLRQELLRMQTLHEAAWAERQQADGTADYRRPDAAVADAVVDVLRRWRRDIRSAWLGERACRTTPRWKHHDVLLELKPRTWHFQEDARERLQRMVREVEQALSTRCAGTFTVRTYPLLALPEHVRTMRRKALALPLHPEQRSAIQDNGAASSRHDQEAAAQPAQPQDNTRKTTLRSSTRLKSTALAALLVLPLWGGWKMISNHETQQKVATLEQRHAAHMARRYWWREEAAGMFSPLKTVQAFLTGLRSGDMPPRPLLLDAESRLLFATLARRRPALRALAAQWNGCGRGMAQVEMNRAVVHWPLQRRHCMPMLLKRQEGRWRIAWADMQRTFARADDGSWRIAMSGGEVPREWMFGFTGTVIAADGRVQHLRGVAQKGGLIVPVLEMADVCPDPPHDENAPVLHTSLLEETSLLAR